MLRAQFTCAPRYGNAKGRFTRRYPLLSEWPIEERVNASIHVTLRPDLITLKNIGGLPASQTTPVFLAAYPSFPSPKKSKRERAFGEKK